MMKVGLGNLMKQAQQMQENMRKAQEQLAQLEVEGQAGAGLVVVTLNGKGDMRRLSIDPKLADPSDVEMLQDLIVAAHNDAKQKLEQTAAAEMQKISGGLNLPPGMKLPF